MYMSTKLTGVERTQKLAVTSYHNEKLSQQAA